MGKRKAFKTVEDLEKAIDNYKQYLQANDRPPTIAGLAYYTGIERQTIYNYEKDEAYFDTIKKLRDWVIMTYEEEAIIKGNGGVVFMLKNYGYTDRQELLHDGSMDIKVSYD